MRFYRRIVKELERDEIIPTLPFEAPELEALNDERKRLVSALREAETSEGPTQVDEAAYVRQRARALRTGKPLPKEPPSQAERNDAEERRRRNVAAAKQALVQLGDDICETVAKHPDWVREAESHVQRAQREADEARQAAEEAERRAARAGVLVQWLQHVAEGDLYIPTPNTGEAPDVSDFVIQAEPVNTPDDYLV